MASNSSVKFKPHLDDNLAIESNLFMLAIHYNRINASNLRWRMLRLRISEAKNKFIDGLNIDTSDAHDRR